MAQREKARQAASRAPRKKHADSGWVLPDQMVWEQYSRIGGSLTPRDVSNILRCADTGDTRRLCDLANEMRQKDGHLQSVLQTRETAVVSLKWELFYPGQDPKSKKGARQLRFVEAALRACKGFRRMVAHQVGSVYFGAAVSEMNWAYLGGRQVVASIRNHPPRRFRFDYGDGRLVWQDESMGKPVDFRAEHPGKFIVSQPRVNGDVEMREGLARYLVWPALFRNWTLSDWLKLAELAWKPWRLGKFTKLASKEDIDALKAIVAGMSSSGAAVHPDTVEVDLQMPNGTAGASSRSDHAGLFETMGREMSKAVLGQTLTTEQGQNGARSLGEVHDSVRRDILENDATWLAETITEQMVEPLVRMNFGPTATVPQFRFITTESADVGTYATAMEKLAKVLRVPAQWLRDQLGIPEPKEGEELVQPWTEPSPDNDVEDKPETEAPDDEDKDAA